MSAARLCLAASLLALAWAAAPASAEEMVDGEIVRYECGDNCYLTILTQDGEELTGLCVAPECQAWNEEAAMPPHLVGEAVTVTVGTGTQFDGEGNDMGEFPAFTTVDFTN